MKYRIPCDVVAMVVAKRAISRSRTLVEIISISVKNDTGVLIVPAWDPDVLLDVQLPENYPHPSEYPFRCFAMVTLGADYEDMQITDWEFDDASAGDKSKCSAGNQSS